MLALVVIVAIAVYAANGVGRLRTHPNAASMLTTAVMKPLPNMFLLAGMVALWPFFLRRPAPPAPRGGATRL